MKLVQFHQELIMFSVYKKKMQAEEVEDRVENFFESAMDKAGDLTKVVADEPNIVPVEKKFQWYIFDVQIRDELTYHSVISNCVKKTTTKMNSIFYKTDTKSELVFTNYS